VDFKLANITTVHVDAIVNAAKPNLKRGGGVCGAIYKAANAPELASECRSLAPCPTGTAVITAAHGLPCRNIIHAVGPIWLGGFLGEARHLSECYQSALQLADQNGFKTIAFPAISTGHFFYPTRAAARIVAAAIHDYFEATSSDIKAVVLCFTDPRKMSLYKAAFDTAGSAS
jgi:O-acetyl-ADP-ribose deacetylase (regulator of RNase III)